MDALKAKTLVGAVLNDAENQGKSHAGLGGGFGGWSVHQDMIGLRQHHRRQVRGCPGRSRKRNNAEMPKCWRV